MLCYVISELWYNRNRLIFEGVVLIPSVVTDRCLNVFYVSGGDLSYCDSVGKSPRVLKEMSPNHSLVGFFDGSSQASSSLYGSGEIMLLDDHSYCKL